MSLTSRLMLKIIETGLIPESAVRLYINRMLKKAQTSATLGDIEARHAVFRQIYKDLRSSYALREKSFDDEPNIEMDVNFYAQYLGKYLSDFSGYFPTGAESLNEAEETMLWMSADRARIRDGMQILELGAGMGAMAFWLANQFPKAEITTVTNSVRCGIHIQKKSKELGLKNLKVITEDFDQINFKTQFDRIISLNKFDLVNSIPGWEAKINCWLKDEGRFFFQFPVHAQLAYYTESVGLKNLPGNKIKYYRLVPSAELLLMFQHELAIEDYWKISGEHYAMTATKWLENFYRNKETILEYCDKIHGRKMAWSWFQRYRFFIIAIIEQYSINRGQDWIVAQYLYKKRTGR